MEERFEEFLKRIEPKWQQQWADAHLFEADPKENQQKYFLTVPYPYVNASAHLGHGYTTVKADFIARYKRMKGFNVLWPQGFHATGEPIVGMAKRLAEGDPIQKKILSAFGVKEEEFKLFEDPYHIVRYFVDLWKRDLKRMGMSIDWRRSFVTTTLTPTYSAFITWQYLTLRELGYVTKGSHPVIYCPQCDSATGDHDRFEGVGATVSEMILLKFPYEDGFMLPATLRPETTYGVTNMYLGPEFEYVKIRVDDKENWFVTRESVQKIADQEHKVEELSSHKGLEFFGKYCKNPVTNDDIIILPAHFIDPTNGTGVVMSVPSHAPVDWVAIKNLQDNPHSLEEFGVTAEQILTIKPISLIKLEGYGEHPAIEIIEEMG
ncbi:MAG: class I tRNA ligase family protein, partial [Candidatus Hodarchaeota archaeon]